MKCEKPEETVEELTPEEMADVLREAANLEGSEAGEIWNSLAAAKAAAQYGSQEFRLAWEKEVKDNYEHFTDNFRIVTRKETREIEYTDLEFLG